MNFIDILKKINNKKIFPVYILYINKFNNKKNENLLDLFKYEIIDNIKKNNKFKIDLFNLDFNKKSKIFINNLINDVSLFKKRKKIIFIKNINFYKEKLNFLLNYCLMPLENNIIILILNDFKILLFFKKKIKLNIYIENFLISKKDICNYANFLIKKNNFLIKLKTLIYFLNNIYINIFTIKNELNNLYLLCYKTKYIKIEDIKFLIKKKNNFISNFINDILLHNKKKILISYNYLLYNYKNLNYNKFFFFLLNQIRIFINIKFLYNLKFKDKYIINFLKISDYLQFEKIKIQEKLINLNYLIKLYNYLIEIDFLIKRKNICRILMLKLFILKIL